MFMFIFIFQEEPFESIDFVCVLVGFYVISFFVLYRLSYSSKLFLTPNSILNLVLILVLLKSSFVLFSFFKYLHYFSFVILS